MASELIEKFKAKMGRNFMTPRVLSYRNRKNRVVELSSGEDFEHKPMYGVTVRDYDYRTGEWHDTPKLSKVFWSRVEAKKHADEALKGVM